MKSADAVHDDGFPVCEGTHFVVILSKPVQTVAVDQAVRAFGHVMEKADLIGLVLLVQIGIILFLIVGIKQQHAVPVQTSQKDIVGTFQVYAQQNCAASCKCGADRASGLDRDCFTGKIFAVDREMPRVGEMIQSVGHIVDSGSRGAAFAQLAVFVVRVHAVEHDKFDNIGINLFAFKEKADAVQKRNGSAVIFTRLVI